MKRVRIPRRFLAIIATGSLLVAGCSGNSGVSGTAGADEGELTTMSTADSAGTSTSSDATGVDADVSEGAPSVTNNDAADTAGDDAADGTLDEKILSGGDHVAWQLGEPVSYYSFANLSTDDVQRVTIESFEYVDAADIPDEETAARADGGELVLHVKWEHVLGDVQSNDGYIVAYPDGSDEGASTAWYRDDNMPNGNVAAGEPKVGTFSYLVDRGPTTLILEDYMGKPVAEMKIDTSS